MNGQTLGPLAGQIYNALAGEVKEAMHFLSDVPRKDG